MSLELLSTQKLSPCCKQNIKYWKKTWAMKQRKMKRNLEHEKGIMDPRPLPLYQILFIFARDDNKIW
jgi:hypothetical protein